MLHSNISTAKRKVLITGGSGFIGSVLAEELIKDQDNYVVIVDDLSTGDLSKLPKIKQDNWHFIKCDVNEYRDIAEIMLAYQFNYVFHYAAVVGVKRTQDHPVKVLKDLHGIENLLNLSKNTGVCRFFFSSSSEVYGEPVEFPQHEQTTLLNSRLPYAIVKNAGEAYVRSYKQEFDLDYTIFRFFNTYGSKQSPDFVMSRFISMALKNEDITIYGDGMQTRTFCHVSDNVKACIKAFNTGMFKNDVVNIGGEEEVPIIELAKTIIDITGSKSKLKNLPPLEDGDMRRRKPDVSNMRQLIGDKRVTLKDGIKEILSDLQYIKG